MKVYEVSIAENLPNKPYAVRYEYWYYTNKRAAKQQYDKVCKKHNYLHTYHENYRFAKSRLHRVNNIKGYNILEVYITTITTNNMPSNNVQYIGW